MTVATTTLIRKEPHGEHVTPNLRDYEAARRSFTWSAARAELDGFGPRLPPPTPFPCC